MMILTLVPSDIIKTIKSHGDYGFEIYASGTKKRYCLLVAMTYIIKYSLRIAELRN